MRGVTDLLDPDALLADAPRVTAALQEAGWSSAALDELLGPNHRTHLHRDELSPLLRRTRGGSSLEQLARAFVLGAPVEDGLLPDSWVRAKCTRM